MKSEAQQRHLEKMHAAARTPEADEKRRATMKRRWADDPTMARTLAGLRSPEVAKRAGMARRRPLAERFSEKVEKHPSGCWLWTGAKNERGYGFIQDCAGAGKLRATHVSLELSGRPRPSGLHALHSCDTPQCVNPDHLRWGTPKENSQDAKERGRLNTSGLIPGRHRP